MEAVAEFYKQHNGIEQMNMMRQCVDNIQNKWLKWMEMNKMNEWNWLNIEMNMNKWM